MSYTIPIPEPKHLTRKVGRVSLPDSDRVLDVYAHTPTNQIVLNLLPYEWYLQKDGNIMESIANFVPGSTGESLVATELFVFEDQTLRKGKAATEPLQSDIYDCEWSDFSCDKLVLHMTVRNYTVRDRYERLAYALALDRTDAPNSIEVLENARRFRNEAPFKAMKAEDDISLPCYCICGSGEFATETLHNTNVCHDCFVQSTYAELVCRCGECVANIPLRDGSTACEQCWAYKEYSPIHYVEE